MAGETGGKYSVDETVRSAHNVKRLIRFQHRPPIYKIMKKKSKPRNKLIEELDNIFSKYIRLRDSDKSGYCRCISCGKLVFWKYIQNGHFVNRKHMSTRFDEYNCNAQCLSCNCFDEGNNLGYSAGLVRKYGKSVLDILLIRKNQMKKWSDFEIKKLINHYKKEVDKLLKEKLL